MKKLSKQETNRHLIDEVQELGEKLAKVSRDKIQKQLVQQLGSLSTYSPVLRDYVNYQIQKAKEQNPEFAAKFISA